MFKKLLSVPSLGQINTLHTTTYCFNIPSPHTHYEATSLLCNGYNSQHECARLVSAQRVTVSGRYAKWTLKVEYEVVPVHAIKARAGVEAKRHSFLTVTLDVDEWPASHHRFNITNSTEGCAQISNGHYQTCRQKLNTLPYLTTVTKSKLNTLLSPWQ
jgi:hypothetical protein